jgi:preprotein translocase SecE subunit
MITRIKRFIRDIQAEWSKVSKPDRKEVQGNTLVVIVACALLGIFLWIIDGNTGYPGWISIHGIILLIGIIVGVTVIARRYTSRWHIAFLISLIPLIVVAVAFFAFGYSIEGFGLALLRSLFIRTG